MTILEFGSGGQLPAELVSSVRQGVTTTFDSMFGDEPDCCASEKDKTSFYSIIGIISFVGDLAWSFMLGLPRETASFVAKDFAGFEVNFDSEDMGDTVGELANIIAGDIVARLDALGVKAALSLPMVVRGKKLEMLTDSFASTQLDFSASYGTFWVTIAARKPR
ncbi:MAG: hypothetical protein GWP06_14695 [Actinobacteria bacterium]|nr:hypothetical protein [Actinomycetota bacterium]